MSARAVCTYVRVLCGSPSLGTPTSGALQRSLPDSATGAAVRSLSKPLVQPSCCSNTPVVAHPGQSNDSARFVHS
ncbi:hypothetical protein K523DRAFT_322738 [Schizophyllum commune Tattone D]|nr:hypothetical protein K523DRAFT_322738 [Schizophyllum commune Tattone D]